MEVREFKRLFEIEARRLRLNMHRLPAFAASAEAENELLERMRRLSPGATWEDVLPGVRLPEPDPLMAEAIAEMDRDPEGYWRQREIDEALWRELERVVLRDPELAAGEGIGFDFPLGREHALRVLRRLPDDAGWQAFDAALASTPAGE